jgi:hypothetical protein
MLKLGKFTTAWVILSITLAAVPASASGPLDSTLYTTYTVTGSTVSLSVCGSVGSSSGCYGSGTLGPFGRLGALLEGAPSTNLNKGTVTRLIYALDIATGSSGTGVVLYVYRKVDTITSSFDSVAVSLFKSVALPLTGGASATASMAANTKFIFIGTNQSTQAVRLAKSNYAILQSANFEPPIPVTAITSDKYGYVTVTFDNPGIPGETGFLVYGADGTLQEDGGGTPFMLNTDQAVLPVTFP